MIVVVASTCVHFRHYNNADNVYHRVTDNSKNAVGDN